MIALLFIALSINYFIMPIGFLFPHSLDWLGDWLFLYVVIAPRIIWFFGLMAGGVFWYYKRKVLFWLNIVGLLFFYTPLVQFYI